MRCTRNYGIDLLRLVLMFMVCVLHIMGKGGALHSGGEGSVHYYVFFLIEVMCLGAVDAFAFISGYIATNKPQNYAKLVSMWFQALFYSFFLTVFFSCIGLYGNWNRQTILKRLFPVTFGQFWYFTAYFALFFSIPLLNPFLFNAKESDCKKALILIFLLFSVLGLLADPFKTQGGYSAIWIIALYCAGVLAKRINLFAQKKTITLIILWFAVNLVSWGLIIFGGVKALYSSYLSPTVFLNGILLVVIFSRLPLKGTIIRHVSPAAFGIYLFQRNPIIWDGILDDRFHTVANHTLPVSVILVLVYSGMLFAGGMVTELIRIRFAKQIRIDRFSQKIADALEIIITKLSALLA